MSLSLADFRQQYPDYDDMSDAELSDALHKRFYGDIPQEQFIEVTQGALPPSPDMGGTQTLPPSDPRPYEAQQAEREAVLQAQERPIPTLREDTRPPQIAAGDAQRAALAMEAAKPAAAFPNVSVSTGLRAPLRPDMPMSSEATEAAASGIVKAVGNTAAGALMLAREGTQGDKLGDRIQEKVDAMPELDGLPHFVEFTTQFLVPFGIFKPGVTNLVSKGKTLLPTMLTPKARAALTSGATQALTSGATAATAFSGQQHRLADYLVTFPQMKNSFTEYLASDPEDTQAEGRLKNAIEFATVDAILQGTLFLALKGIKGAAAKSAPSGDIDMALALENVKPADAKSVRQDLARFSAEEVSAAGTRGKVALSEINTNLRDPRRGSPEGFGGSLKGAVAAKDSRRGSVFLPDLPEAARNALHKTANFTGRAFEKAVGWADPGIRPISSLIDELDPKSLRKLYQYELEKGKILTGEFAKVEPFLKSLKKLPSAERERIRKFWMNSDMAGINGVLGRHVQKIPSGQREFKNVRDALEDMYDLARENGEEVFYRREYLPRIVRDYEGMKAHRGTKEPLQRAIDAATKKKGTPLTMIQEREVIGEYMNKLYRGDGTPGYMKNRVIDKVPQDLMKYYGSVEDMLTSYVQNLTNRVAKARYVGKSPMLGPRSGWKDVLNEQIQLRKLDPKRGISVGDAAKVRELIKARLGADAVKIGTGGKIWRDFVHMTSIANPISTLTQVPELLINAHRYGYLNTIGAAGKQIKGSPITLSEIGVTDIAAEYADTVGAMEVGNWAKVQKLTNKTLEGALTVSGFRKLDAVLKNNNLNAAFVKARKLVGNKGTKAYQEFAQEQGKFFGKETKELMDAIRANDHDNPLVKEYLFHQLSKTQPISLSEYPAAYLKGGSVTRSAYYLKSFTMKMLETTRRDLFRKLASPDRKVAAGAMKQFLTLSALAGGVAGNNQFKSILLDRDEGWWESVADGILTNFGLSRYASQKFRSENPMRRAYSVVDIILPAKLTDAFDVGLTTLTEGEVPWDRIERQVPVLGKLFSEWFGAGHKRKVKERRADRNKKLKRMRGK